MVTLANTQNYSEFELHARAILGIEIPEIKLLKSGASAVILAEKDSQKQPEYIGLNQAASIVDTDFKLFGKPTTRRYRRMGVALAYGEEDVSVLVKKARQVADSISIVVN